MRNTLFTTAMMLGLVAASTFAQAQTITTQTPPSPNSSEAGPQPDGSVPRSAETSERYLPGSVLNGQAAAPASTTTRTSGRMAAIATLKAQLATTRTAVGSGDYETARQQFTAFHDGWDGTIERDVKARLTIDYDRYEGAEEILAKHLVNPATPDKTKVLGALQAIADVLDRYSALTTG